MVNILELDLKKPLVNLTTDIVFSQYTRGYANVKDGYVKTSK